MTVSPKLVVADGYERFNARGVPGIADLLDEHIDWFSLDQTLKPRQLHGSEEVTTFLAEALSPGAGTCFDVLDMTECGNRIGAWTRLRTTRPGAAREAIWEAGHLWLVRRGKLRRFRLYLSRARLERAVAAGRARALTGPSKARRPDRGAEAP